MAWDNSGRIEHVVRVLAGADGTMVTTSDPMLGAQLDRGEFAEFGPLTAPLRIDASAPVAVAQYLVGKQVGALASDPSLIIPAPVQQFRSSAAVWVFDDWPVALVDVIAPAGAQVTLDGAPIAGFTPLADVPGFEAAAVVAAPGRHVVSADQPVGVTVYGYSPESDIASYGYGAALAAPVP